MSEKLSLKLSKLKMLQKELEMNHKKNQQFIEFRGQQLNSNLNHFNYADFELFKNLKDIDLIDFSEDLSTEVGRNASTHLSPILEENLICNETLNQKKILNEFTNMNNSKVLKKAEPVNIDDLPVTPGIDGNKVKDFEELINKSIKEPFILIEIPNSQLKRPYLKKGSGLLRFQPKSLNNNQTEKSDKEILSLKEIKKSQNNEQSRKVNLAKISQKSLQSESFEKENEITKDNSNISLNQLSLTKKCRKVTFPETNNSKKLTHTSLKVPVVEKHFYPKNNANEITLLDETDFSKIDDKIAMLEKVLEAVQLKKQKLKEEFEQDLFTHDSDWEDEKNEIVPLCCQKKIHKKPKKCKKLVKNNDKNFKNNISICDFLLDLTCKSDYAIAMKNKIEDLEQRLQRLKNKCFQNAPTDIVFKKQLEEESLFPKKIFEEMINIKDQLNSVHDKLQMLELSNAQKQTKETCRAHYPKKELGKNLVEKHIDPSSEIKEIKESPNGQHIFYKNGDEMIKCKDDVIVYIYANGTKQTTYSDGLKIIEFPNGQLEKIHANGIKHIHYLNNTERILYPNGSEETVTNDGTIIRLTADGKEIVEMPNGEREIRTNEYKRREYFNGTVKTLYSSGIVETRYPNGRLRIKDKNGTLIADSVIKFLQNLVPS